MPSLLWGFEQFDGIARRVVEQDLVASHTYNYLIAEVGSRFAQGINFLSQVVHL